MSNGAFRSLCRRYQAAFAELMPRVDDEGDKAAETRVVCLATYRDLLSDARKCEDKRFRQDGREPRQADCCQFRDCRCQ